MKKYFASEIALHRNSYLHENLGVFNKYFQQPSKLIKLFGIKYFPLFAEALVG